MEEFFYMSLDDLFPSQLYLNEDKIQSVKAQIDPFILEKIPPISIKKFGSRVVFLDGHTRAFLAYCHGLTHVPVYWETEEYDWQAYDVCINWCIEEQIFHIKDLESRIVDNEAYSRLWIGRCEALQEGLERSRRNPGEY